LPFVPVIAAAFRGAAAGDRAGVRIGDGDHVRDGGDVAFY
jgi:hypothetical protein